MNSGLVCGVVPCRVTVWIVTAGSGCNDIEMTALLGIVREEVAVATAAASDQRPISLLCQKTFVLFVVGVRIACGSR
jgi:hypothetical protein